MTLVPPGPSSMETSWSVAANTMSAPLSSTACRARAWRKASPTWPGAAGKKVAGMRASEVGPLTQKRGPKDPRRSDDAAEGKSLRGVGRGFISGLS